MYKILLIILLLPTFIVISQNKKIMSFEDMYDVVSVNSGRISPNGQKLLFTVTEYNLKNNKYITQLWIKDLYQKKAPYKVTFKDSNCTSPSWHPSGKKVSYLTNNGSNTDQIYLLDLKSGTKIKLTNHFSSIKSYGWVSEEKIYFLADDEDEIVYSKKNRATYFYEEDNNITSLWEFNIVSKETKKLTNDLSVRTFKLSPDNKFIAITASSSSRPNDEQKIEIYLVKLEDLTYTRITNNNIIEKQLGWSRDGSFITFISDANEKLELYYQDSIFKLDLKTKTITDLLPGFSYQVLDHQWNWKNNTIYFTVNKGATQQIFSLDLNYNKVVQNTNTKGVIRNFTLYSYKDKIIYLMSDPEIPGDFYLTDLKKWRVKRLTNSNKHLENYAFGTYKTIYWKSYDGQEVEGVIIFPPNFKSNKKYPLVVQLHGGPNSSYKLEYGFSWVTYPNILAGKEYIILQPNFRGSSGYGDGFMRGIIGNFFKSGYEDIISGVDYLINNGIVDQNRMSISGFSAGAHFTNWIITQTNRFKAASSGAGLSNWVSFYAQNEVPYLREIWMNSNPYESIENWTKQSPISYANKVKTPTFFYCGEKDPRVPFAQTLEMWRALKRYNVPTRLLSLPDEGHYIGDLQRQLTKMKAEYAWIEKYSN